LERIRRLNSWSGGKNLPGILFGGTGKIFRRQYWNVEYSRIERWALISFCNSSEFEFGDLA
jgi:hypothetical protein